MADAYDNLWKLIGLRYKSHPWHGIDIGSRTPRIVSAFIEVIPSDTVKYEVDKKSGYLMIDRPQKFSNIVPALYGFIPQTYCKQHVADFCMKQTGREGIIGDDDPLDICVLTEREVTHGNIIVKAKAIGGFRMLDGGEADDKIIAVLENDEVYGSWNDITDLPPSILDRLQHYFLTYKQLPGKEPKVEITHTYNREEAQEVIRLSQRDYAESFGNLETMMSATLMEALSIGQRQQDILSSL
ncbi:Inorganic pyrophosphatase [Neolewinella maritima]|uniref:inorganic diphosphatase n=1 Tax=Neolewinella maritima TaxID=1383882 RepID=A0ABN8FA92_9BACT|nr:inorganic pyrophosphatase [Neolewinella maritima]CAH1001451.1 Inorganic pyrophosphatase [Neolewinella maritima]